jgi:predicted nucleic acid-binding protein
LSATAPRADERRLYADASALVKLILREPESDQLIEHLGTPLPALTTSRLAVVEVSRAVKIANPKPEIQDEVARLLGFCVLLQVTGAILQRAAALSSERLRTIDAIHLASIVRVEPHSVLAYDRRLVTAARGLGFDVSHPGVDL